MKIRIGMIVAATLLVIGVCCWLIALDECMAYGKPISRRTIPATRYVTYIMIGKIMYPQWHYIAAYEVDVYAGRWRSSGEPCECEVRLP